MISIRPMIFAAALLIAGPALAMDYQTAKAQGLVCERPDGLIQATTASADVQAVVKQVNDGRMAQYRDLAAKNGTSVQAVQAVTGQKLTAQNPCP